MQSSSSSFLSQAAVSTISVPTESVTVPIVESTAQQITAVVPTPVVDSTSSFSSQAAVSIISAPSESATVPVTSSAAPSAAIPSDVDRSILQEIRNKVEQENTAKIHRLFESMQAEFERREVANK